MTTISNVKSSSSKFSLRHKTSKIKEDLTFLEPLSSSTSTNANYQNVIRVSRMRPVDGLTLRSGGGILLRPELTCKYEVKCLPWSQLTAPLPVRPRVTHLTNRSHRIQSQNGEISMASIFKQYRESKMYANLLLEATSTTISLSPSTVSREMLSNGDTKVSKTQ